MNNYSKVAGYKVNTQKSITCLYTSNEQLEFEIKNTIPCTLASPPQMKYLGISLTKQVHNIYEENYKAVKKNIKEEPNREIYHVLGLEESIFWK